jgi:hypothetical protein
MKRNPIDASVMSFENKFDNSISVPENIGLRIGTSHLILE